MRPGADRRTVLRAGLAGIAGLGAAGTLAACGDGGAASPAPSESPSATTTLDPERSWDSLARRLTGRLVRPTDTDYDAARALFDPAFDGVRPQGIAYCVTSADVAEAIRFGRASGVPLAARCGGHSYGGYSTTDGLIVDVTRMNQVTPGATATVGAGARLIKVYTDLAAAGQAIPAGSCPTVGIAGLALGGGIGVVGRRYGLTCDRMTGAEVVLASGEIVRTDANHDADLFWALRGGGGGNVGIVTSFSFATHAARSLTLFTLRWPWTSAPEVLAAWQDWITGRLGTMPDELWSTLVATSAPPAGRDGSPGLRVNGVFVGEPAGLAGPLADLTAAVSRAPSSRSVVEHDHLTAMRIEGGCPATGDCGSTNGIRAGAARAGQHAASALIERPVSAAGQDVLLRMVEERQREPGAAGGGFILDSWGGAINRVGPAETAFVHRAALASVQYIAGYPAGASAATLAANQRWLRDTAAAAAPYLSGSAYQNYIDPDLATWEQAYYGENLARLRTVKRLYDPDNLFHSAQSIPLT